MAGIDISKDELVVCLGRLQEDLVPELTLRKAFPNTKKGMASLLGWTRKQSSDDKPVCYVMEATGVYHESLAYMLHAAGEDVSIVLPNKISNFFRTLDVKTITDNTAAEAIALFGLSRRLSVWAPPKEVYRTLRHLTRERDQVVTERTIAKNQLHAEKAQAHPGSSTIKRIKARIKMLDNQVAEIEKEIKNLIASDKDLAEAVTLITSITGIGTVTGATILAETNGFELIRNRRQLASYAGFDVKERQSGISIKGKPRISKRGNKYLRKAMFYPALSAIRHDKNFNAVYQRIKEKGGISRKAEVAVQRRLLEMSYTIFKTQKLYSTDYKEHLKRDEDGRQLNRIGTHQPKAVQ